MSGASGARTGAGHKLTQLVGENGRTFERHDISLPCRLSYTAQHMRGVTTMFALARNVSRSGVMLVAQQPVSALYVAVEFAPGEAPCAAVVRRARGVELGCEFLAPLSARYLIELLTRSTE